MGALFIFSFLALFSAEEMLASISRGQHSQSASARPAEWPPQQSSHLPSSHRGPPPPPCPQTLSSIATSLVWVSGFVWFRLSVLQTPSVSEAGRHLCLSPRLASSSREPSRPVPVGPNAAFHLFLQPSGVHWVNAPHHPIACSQAPSCFHVLATVHNVAVNQLCFWSLWIKPGLKLCG